MDSIRRDKHLTVICAIPKEKLPIILPLMWHINKLNYAEPVLDHMIKKGYINNTLLDMFVTKFKGSIIQTVEFFVQEINSHRRMKRLNINDFCKNHVR